MKTSFLYFSLFCFVLAGCKDNDIKSSGCQIQFNSSVNSLTIAGYSPKHPCDYMMASKNGEQWAVHAETSFGFKNDTLYVYGQGNEESMTFKLLFAGPGTYEIQPKTTNQYFNGNAYYYLTLGGDVIISQYVLAEKAIVEIVEYNEKEKVIKGNFEFSFMGGSSTKSFKNGTFSVHLPD